MSLLVVLWMVIVDTRVFSGLAGWAVASGLLISYLVLAFSLSLGFALFGLLYSKLGIKPSSRSAIVLLPTIWVICEWLRSWPYSVPAIGQNSTIGHGSNFGDLGFAVSVTPLGYAGRLIGLYGLSFMVVAFNLALFRLLQRRWKMPAAVIPAVLLLAAAGYLIYAQPNGKTVNVGALQTGSDTKMPKNANYLAYLDRLDNRLGERFDLLVLPESSGLFEGNNINTSRDVAVGLMADTNSPIITSRDRREPGKKFNTLTAYNSTGEILYQRDKQFLIPIGETLPYVFSYVYKQLGNVDDINTLLASRETARGLLPDSPYEAGGLKIGSAVCSAVIRPDLYRKQVSEGAELLTNSSSLSMFGKSSLFYQQYKQMGRFIAVSNARPFAQATNGGYSTILDHNGRQLAVNESTDKQQLIRANPTTNLKRTPYSVIGEWVLWLSFLLVFVSILKIHLKTRKKS